MRSSEKGDDQQERNVQSSGVKDDLKVSAHLDFGGVKVLVRGW